MSASKKPKVDVWLAVDGWRWQYRSENGLVQAVAPEGYSRRGDCVAALRRIGRGLPLAEIRVGEGPAKAPPPRLTAAYRPPAT